MAQILLQAGGIANTLLSNSETQFGMVCGTISDVFDPFTEAENQVTIYTAGTFSFMSVLVGTNTSNGTVTMKFRKNLADGNQLISVGAGLTGEFFDTTNSDTVVSGDEVNYTFINAGTGDVEMYLTQIQFSATSNTVTKVIANESVSYTAASTTYYTALFARVSSQTTDEARRQHKLRSNGTLRNLFVIATSNARSTTTVIKSRINSADGNCSVSIGASATGFFEDTSNSDSLSSGDLVNSSVTTDTGTGALNITCISYEFETTNFSSILGSSSPSGRTLAQGTTRYSFLCGDMDTGLTATESNTQLDTKNNFTASNMFCYLSANTIVGNSTMGFRKNSGDGNQSISLTGLTTGLFEDSSNTDTVITTDVVNYKFVGGAAGTSATIILTGLKMVSSFSATITPSVLSITTSLPSPTKFVQPSALSITASVQTPSISRGVTIVMAASVGVDSITEGQTTGTTLSIPHTLGGNSNRIVTFGLTCEFGTITSVKYNNVNMLTAVDASAGGRTSTLYYLLESSLPVAGVYNVDVVLSGAGNGTVGGVASFYNVAQSAPQTTNTNINSGTSSISTDVTLTAANELVVDCLYNADITSFTATGIGQNIIFSTAVSGGSNSGAGSYVLASAPGVRTLSWTFTFADAHHAVAAFLPGPSVANLTVSIPSPTVSVVTNVTVTPSVLSIVASVQAPALITSSTLSPSALSAIVSLPSPTISIGGGTNVTVTPGVLSIIASIQAVVQSATISPTFGLFVSTTQTPSFTQNVNVTITPSVLSIVASIQAPTITTVRNLTTSPGVLSITVNAIAPAISTSTTISTGVLSIVVSTQNPTVSTSTTIVPNALSAVVSVQNPVISAGGNVTITPSVLSIVASVQAPAISTSTTISTGVLSVVVSTVAPSISTSTTLSFNALSIVASVQNPTVSAGGNVSITPSVLSIVASVQNPTITAVQNLTFSAGVLSITTSVQAPSISLSTTISPNALSAVVSVQAPTFSLGTTISTNVLSIVVNGQAPAISLSTTISVNVLSITVNLQAPSISAGGNVSVTVGVLGLVVSQPAPSVLYGTTISPSTLSVVASVQNPTVSVSTDVTISPNALSITVNAQAPTVTNGLIYNAGVLTLTVNQQAPSLITSSTITVSAQSLVASIQAPTVSGAGNVTIAVGVLSLTVNLQNVTVILTTVQSPDTLSIIASVIAPTIVVVRHITISLGVITITATNPAVDFGDSIVISLNVLPLTVNLNTVSVLLDKVNIAIYTIRFRDYIDNRNYVKKYIYSRNSVGTLND